MIDSRAERSETDKPAREKYTMYAKSILLVGQPDGAYRRAIGFPIEIVPEADPYAIKSGESLPVQIGRAFGRRSRLKSPKTQPDERRICQINGNRRLRGDCRDMPARIH